MIFVQNFTEPDFQAKSFTPQKCGICDIFLANYANSFGHFLVIIGLISSMSTVLEIKIRIKCTF